VSNFLLNLKIRFGMAVICDECDADDIVMTKRSVRKFYNLHSGMHRHPAGRLKLVS